MEAFDPLSLFSPVKKYTNEPGEYFYNDSYEAKGDLNESDDDSDDDDDLDAPIHILDLPVIRSKPPYVVLMVILKLLAPNETLNFGPSSPTTDNEIEVDASTVFTEKGLDQLMVNEALLWLETRCPRLNTVSRLACLPAFALGLRNNYAEGYFSYMTRIVSSELAWIDNELFRSALQKEASLRISESCGRTAQPEIIRKIVINGLQAFHVDDVIRLKEPTLTSDNLGLKTWGSSLILAQRLITFNSEKQYLRSPVLELGSGTGLGGIASCILGYKTYLTDLREIVPNLKDNIELNNIGNALAGELDWTNVSTFTAEHGNIKFPTILVSDPIYLEQHPYFLMNAIREMADFSEQETRILIQIPLRPKYENERALLWQLMEQLFIMEDEKIEKGYDDFGEMSFCFRMYRIK